MTMKTTKGALAGLVLALALASAPVAGQQDRDECRCVDADGGEIENCRCWRTPGLDGLASALSFFGDDRPRLGVSVDPMQSARLDAEGARVTDVMDGGPADEAGIRAGDLITHVDGRALTAPLASEQESDFDLDASIPVQRLLALTRELEPGAQVEVEYLRDGDRRRATVQAQDLSASRGRELATPRWNQERLRDQLRELTDNARVWRFRNDRDGQEWRQRGDPRDEAPPAPGPRPEVRIFGGPGGGWLGGGLGLQVVEVNPELGAYFGAEEGVLVTHVERSSGLGLRPGDVVLRVGDRRVTTPDRFRRIVASYGAEEDIELYVLRDGEETVVTGRLRY
jgi:hypothetical protein